MILLRDKTFSEKEEKKIGKKARNAGILTAGTGLSIFALGKLADKISKGKSQYVEKIIPLVKKNKNIGLALGAGGTILGIVGEVKRRKEKKEDDIKKENKE